MMNMNYDKGNSGFIREKLLATIMIGVLIVCIALTSGGCKSYTKGPAVLLTHGQATDDLKFLAEKVKAIHPDPFTRISEEKFDARIQKMTDNIGESISRMEFALYVAEALAMIRDAHTGTVPRWGDAYERTHCKMFPLQLRLVGNQFIVTAWAKGVQPKSIKPGDRVVAINDRPMSYWAEKYRRYISGETDTVQDQKLARLFRVFFWHTHGTLSVSKVTLEDRQGRVYSEILPSVYPIFPAAETNQPSYIFYRQGDVCFLKIPSFDRTKDYVSGTDGIRQAFQNTFNEMFSAMDEKGTSLLIVDLRGNGGGDGGLGLGLIRRVAQKPFTSLAKRWRYSEAYQDALLIFGLRNRGLPLWLHKFISLQQFRPVVFEAYVREGEYLTSQSGTDHPIEKPWPGKLAILVDQGTFSAAVDMAVIVKDNGLGLIAGEESGGRASCYTEYAPVYMRNSGFLFAVSSAQMIRPAGYDDGHGVLPDLPMDPMLDDKILVRKIWQATRHKVESTSHPK